MKAMLILPLLLLLTTMVHCGLMHQLDLLVVKNQSFFQCYRDSGYNRSIIEVIEVNYAITNLSIQNSNNAKSAGIDLEAIITPCRTRTAQQQIQVLNKAFPTKIFDRYWITLLPGVSICSWSTFSGASNCQYLKQLLYTLQVGLNATISVMSKREVWYDVFKDYDGCPEVSDKLLWWIPDNWLDQKPDFTGYVPFGGWNKPFAKLFSSKFVCGGQILETYYQES